jgi:hypothetical protein
MKKMTFKVTMYLARDTDVNEVKNYMRSWLIDGQGACRPPSPDYNDPDMGDPMWDNVRKVTVIAERKS